MSLFFESHYGNSYVFRSPSYISLYTKGSCPGNTLLLKRYFFMFCCTLLYVHSSVAIILMGKRELIALLNLSSWCLMMVERLFLAVPQGCLQFVIVVFPDHTHLLFLVFPMRTRIHYQITLFGTESIFVGF